MDVSPSNFPLSENPPNEHLFFVQLVHGEGDVARSWCCYKYYCYYCFQRN